MALFTESTASNWFDQTTARVMRELNELSEREQYSLEKFTEHVNMLYDDEIFTEDHNYLIYYNRDHQAYNIMIISQPI